MMIFLMCTGIVLLAALLIPTGILIDEGSFPLSGGVILFVLLIILICILANAGCTPNGYHDYAKVPVYTLKSEDGQTVAYYFRENGIMVNVNSRLEVNLSESMTVERAEPIGGWYSGVYFESSLLRGKWRVKDESGNVLWESR